MSLLANSVIWVVRARVEEPGDFPATLLRSVRVRAYDIDEAIARAHFDASWLNPFVTYAARLE